MCSGSTHAGDLAYTAEGDQSVSSQMVRNHYVVQRATAYTCHRLVPEFLMMMKPSLKR